MYASILITLALSTTQPYPEEFERLYTEETEITYDDPRGGRSWLQGSDSVQHFVAGCCSTAQKREQER